MPNDYYVVQYKKINVGLVHIVNKECDKAYYENCLSIQIRKDVNKNLKIAFSPEHGTSFYPVMNTLSEAGYQCIPVSCQSNPDPAFSGTKTPNPELPGAYEEVLKLAKQIDAKLLLVTDPDGDRMGVGILHNGEYVVLNGNQTGALLLEYILSSYEDLGIKVDNPCMFNTIVTSDIGEAIARYHGCDNERTLTGFKYIGGVIADLEKVGEEKRFLLGFEESCGYLTNPAVRDKDAVNAMILIAEMANDYKHKGITLVDRLEQLYNEFGDYKTKLLTYEFKGVEGLQKIKDLMKLVREDNITNIIPGVDHIGDYKKGVITYSDHIEPTNLPISDVVKFFLKDNETITIRPSGTEPKLKAYIFANGQANLDKLVKVIENIIK